MNDTNNKYKEFVLKYYWIIMPVLSAILVAVIFLFGMAVGHSVGHFCY